MFHPLSKVHRKESDPTMPPWMGVAMLVCALIAAGWMTVATLSIRSWVVGIVGAELFLTALFLTIGYLFPEDRR